MSDNSASDTIFAVATAAGRAGVAIVRVSGPNADAALLALSSGRMPDARMAKLITLYDKINDVRIDTALTLRFPAPHSYTGENVVEFQIHGGPSVGAALLRALAVLPGFRMAEAGEFTRRAVENGRLDLTQAEAIADLVAAETEAQRRQALRQLEGQLGGLYEKWRARLIRAAAWIEATIDFPDEEIPADSLAQSRASLSALAEDIRAHLNDGRRGEILRDGFHVAVIGPPNAGKSSLVNALARRDVAIVSEIAGTTRDVIEVRLDLKGYPVILADTAGLREARDAIEAEGIKRAQKRAVAADFRLLVLDGTGSGAPTDVACDLVVWNKADVAATKGRGLWLSAKTGEGLRELIDLLAEHAAKGLEGEAPVITRARHREALEQAAAALLRASALEAPDLAAENVRIAANALGRITGRIDLDELLDVVFRDFCIGK